MKRLIALAALALCGCATGPNTEIIESNPPWCQDYVLTIEGKKFLCHNGPRGYVRVPLEAVEVQFTGGDKSK